MGARSFVLDDGTVANVPDASIDAWMKRMDARGVGFRDAKMSSDMSQGEPTAIHGGIEHPMGGGSDDTDLAAAGARDQSLRAQQQPAPPTAAPDDRPGWLRGLTSDMNTEAQPNGALMAEYGGALHGASWGADSLIPGVREANAQAQAEHPSIYGAADEISGLMTGPTGSIPRQIATSGAQAFARDFSDADPEQPASDRAVHALETGVGSAAATAGVNGLVGIIGGAAGAVKRTAQATGDAARLRSWGTSAAELEAHAAQNALTPGAGVRNFVQRGEELVPPNKIVPMSPSQINERARPIANRIGAQVDENLGAAASQGAQLPPKPQAMAANNLTDLADKARVNGTAAGNPLAGAYDAEALAARRNLSAGGPFTDPRDVRAAKTSLQQVAYKGTPGSPESFAGQGAEAAANQYRGMLDNYVGQASPEVQAAYRQTNADYGVAQGIANSTAGETFGQAANAGQKIPGSVSGIGSRVAASVPGMAYDAAANAARGVQGAAGAVQGAGNFIARDAPTGAGMAGLITAATGGSGQPPAEPDNSQDAKDTKGYLVPKLIQQNPSMLGKYAKDFENLTNEDQVAATVEKLARDPADPDFAMQVLPLYESMTRQ